MHIAVMVFLSSDLARVGIHIHTRSDLLAMQSFPLFEKDEHDTDRYDGSQHDKPGNETEAATNPTMAPHVVTAAQYMYRPWMPKNSRGRCSPLNSG